MVVDKRVFPRTTRAAGWQRLARLVAALTLACLVLFGLLAAMGAFRLSPAAAAGPLYVAPGGTDSGDCTNSAAPCATVQYAVDQAAGGDEILVAAGVYTGVSLRAGETQLVYVTKNVTLRGGYTPANWLVSDPDTNPTVLDAQNLGRVFYLAGAASPTIAGFIIENGIAPTNAEGGAAYIASGAPVFAGNIIRNNSANVGGAFFNQGGSPRLERNKIYGNSANGGGGGFYTLGGSSTSRNNIYYNNRADAGGGVANENGSLTVTNDVFYANTANFGGGLANAGTLQAVNTIIASNVTTSTEALYHYDIATSATTVDYSLFWNNTGGDYSAAVTIGSGIITGADPLFVNAASGDFHLEPLSPAVDQGDPAGLVEIDFEGEGRPFGLGFDIGADEMTEASSCYARLDGGRVYTTVQAAVSAAPANGVVQVAGRCPGTVSMGASLTVRGGYTRTDWLNARYGPAILDAEGNGRVISATAAVNINLVLENLRLTGGVATNGAGVYLGSNVSAVLRNNVIDSNQASGNGGGIFKTGAGLTTLQHNTIYGNTAGQGGGVYAAADAGLITMRNNLVVGNTAGGGIFGASGRFSLGYNAFYNNAGGSAGGGATLPATDFDNTRVPGLTNPGGGDFHLNYETSQVIDAADPASSLPTDFDGHIRPQGARRDIGADESQYYIAATLSQPPGVLITNTATLPNRVFTFAHTLTNTSYTPSGGDQTFTLNINNSDGWDVELVPAGTTINLGSGDSHDFQVIVTAPSTVPDDIYNQTFVEVRNQANNTLLASATDLIANPGVQLAPSYSVNADPGTVLTFTHTLTNTGPVSDTFDLSLSSSMGWGRLAAPLTPTVTLEGDETTQVLVVVEVPPSAPAELADLIRLTAVSTINDGVSASVVDSVTANGTTGTRYVAPAPAGTNVDNNCTQQDTPCATINHALNQAAWGDSVLVARGTYPQSGEMEIKQNISLYGDYIFDTGTFSRSSPVDPNRTVIDAQNLSRGLRFRGLPATIRPVVDGFTIRNATVTGQPGGAIYLESTSSPTLTHLILENSQAGNGAGLYVDAGRPDVVGVTIRNTTASNRGGAVYVGSGSPLLSNLTISTTTAANGGGIYLAGGSARLESSSVYSASATTAGGGIYVSAGNISGQELRLEANRAASGGGLYQAGGTLVISRTRASSNTAASGGAFYNSGGSLSLWNNFVYSNTATGNGGGLYQGSGSLNVTNDTFYGNQASGAGGAIYDTNSTTLVVSNTIFAANSAGSGAGGLFRNSAGSRSVDFNLFWNNPGGDTGGSGLPATFPNTIFGQDPLFVDPAAGDLHLTGDSPAVDRADPATRLASDIDGDRRPINQGPDIGADELGGCLVRNSNTGIEYGVVQQAIDEATSGDVLQVSGICRGVQPRLVGGQIISQTAIITKSLSLHGGFNPGSWTTPNPDLYPTTLDAQGQGRVVVITSTGSTLSVVLTGLTLQNGQAVGLNGAGGGVYNFGSNNLTVHSSVISGSQATLGGGLYSSAGLLVVGGLAAGQQTQFAYNNAQSGGGLYLAGGNANIDRTAFVSNTATAGGGLYLAGGLVNAEVITAAYNSAVNGGGIYNASSSPVSLERGLFLANRATAGNGGGLVNAAGANLELVNTLVASNTTTGNGGGLYNRSDNLEARHDTFYANHADGQGGGIYNDDPAGGETPLINSTLLAANTAGAGGSGIYSPAAPVFDYNNLFNNNSSFTANGTNYSGLDPNFLSTDPTSATFLRIPGGSPVEDRGDPDSPVLVDIDLDGRPSNQSHDIGADEVGGCYARINNQPTTYGSVQRAVGDANPGDKVKIAGTCTGVLAFIDGGQTVSQTVFLTKSLTLEGGYTRTNWNTPNPVANPTTLDALERGRVLYVTGGAAITATGLRLRQGVADNGGAVYVDDGELALSRSAIYSSTAVNGGGLYLASGVAVVYDDNEIFANTATHGGGAYNAGGDLTLDDNNLHHNQATSGGAYYHAGGTSLLQNNIIHRNEAEGGGGFYNAAGDGLTARHNTLYLNTATDGGGFYNAAGNPTVVSTIFATHTVTGAGHAIFSAVPYAPRYNNAFPAANAYNANVTPDSTNLSVDPRFVDAAAGDFHLQTDSPVIDQGDPAMTLPTDFDDDKTPPDLRPGGQGFDIGADEIPGCRARILETGVIYGNVQTAIDNSQPGQTVQVTAVPACGGVHAYNPGTGEVFQTVHVPHSLELIGGYNNAFNDFIGRSTLNPLNQGRAMYVAGGVVLSLTNFVLQNGNAVAGGGGEGGGLYYNGSRAFLSNLQLTANTATNGGGLFVAGSSLSMTTSSIYSNSATSQGGGIYIDAADSGLDLAGNRIYENEADQGGGIYNRTSSGKLDRGNRIYDNQATSGGGLYSAGGALKVWNTFIYGNQAANGAGLFIAGGAAEVLHNTLYNNANSVDNGLGGGAYLAAAGSMLHSNIFLDNLSGNGGDAVFAQPAAGPGLSLDYNDYYPYDPGRTVQNVNQGANSLTVPPALANPAAGEFHLNFGSPMINQAEPNTDVNHDFEDDPRPINGAWDIGADERNDCLAQVWRGSVAVSEILGSIGQAINEATAGDTVRVATGICYERITINRDLTLSGSWNKGFTARQGDLNEPTDANTIIDAGQGGRAVFISTAGSVSMEWLRLTNGEAGNGGALHNQDADLTLTGMYVYSNTATGDGGGLYLGSNSVTTLNNSDISDNNTTTGNGGGIYNGGQLTFNSSLLQANSASGNGGGIFNAENSRFEALSGGIDGNQASGNGGAGYNSPGSWVRMTGGEDGGNIAQNGGGYYNDSASFDISNRGIDSNEATGDGGAIRGDGGAVYVTGASTITFTNVFMYGNQATGNGGGLYRNASGSGRLYHNTINENQADQQGGGVFNAGNGLVISASIVSYNTSGSGSNGIQSSPDVNTAYILSAPGTTHTGIAGGTGSFEAPPNFLPDSDGALLSYNSPAIDKVPESASGVTGDAYLNPRPWICSKDIGIDEYMVGVRQLTPINPAPNAATVIPTDSATYTFSLSNDSQRYTLAGVPGVVGSGYTETLTVTVNSSRNWARIVDVTNVGDLVIQPDGQSATFAVGPAAYVGPANVVVVVTVPAGTYGGLVDETRLAYQAFECANYVGPASPSGLTPPVRTTVTPAHVFSIGPSNSGFALPGQTVTYTHILTNEGNITDTYDIIPSLGFYAGGIQDLTPAQITLSPGQTTPITISYPIKPEAAAGLTDTTSVIVSLNVDDEFTEKGAANNTLIGYATGTRYVALGGDDSVVTESDDSDVINDNNCTDPVLTRPCRTIQHAINQASPGDRIKIAGGEYTDLVAVLSGGQVVTQTAFIDKRLTLQGGYDETDIDSWFIEPPAHITFTTSLNPQNQGRALYIVATDVVTIDRLVLTNGDAGGGSGPTGGGLIYNQQAGLVLHANRLANGSAAAGGGLYSAGGDLLLQNNMLHDNTAAGAGGAINAANGAVRLENNTFFRNDATGGAGGAMFVDDVTLVVSNTIFAGNTASDVGGAIRAEDGSSGTLAYNLYFDNSPDNVSGLSDAGLVTSGNPLFIDTAADPPNLHIQGGSPAQNTGDPDTGLAIDYDNDPRPQPLNSTLFDIGADEDVLEPDLEFEPDVITSTIAGSTIVITHYLTNTGEFTDTYTITFSSSHPGWVNPPQPTPYTVELGQGEMTPVVVTYTVPSDADGLTSVTVFTATSAAGVWDVVSDTIKVRAPAWAIAKTVEPDPVAPGGTLTYTLTITNIGDLNSTGTYTITDTLPEFTEFVSSANPGATLDGREVRWVQSSQVISNGGAVSFSLVLTVTRPLTDGTPIVNDTYGVTGGGAVEDAAGDPITVTVSAPAGLSISKTAQPSPVQPGDFLTYTLTITNDAAGPALGVVISDTLSPDVVYQSMGFDGGLTGVLTATPPILQWGLAEPLAANATVQVTATVRVLSPLAAPALLTNTFSVTATNLAAIVSDTITTPLEATHIITLSKSVFPDEVTPGATVTYTIRLTNTGNGIASVSLTDTLAAGFTPPVVVTSTTVPGRDWGGSSTPVSVVFTATVPAATGVYYNPAVTATYGITGEAAIEQTAPVTVTAPIITFSGPDYTVNENAGPAVITVTLSAPSSLTATVKYATADGAVNPALAGSDYTGQTGVITFAPGATLQTFSVPITDDTVFEGDETVALSLSEAGNATLGAPDAATLTIVDLEDAPQVRFETAAYSVVENVGSAVITVTLSATSDFTATVGYFTRNGTAEAGSDYTAQTGVITFAPGTTVQTFSVPITDDGIFESDETVELILSDPDSFTTLGAPDEAILTIVNNDSQPSVSFEALDYSVSENNSPAVIAVTLSAVSGVAVTVNYATTEDGSATPVDDYTAQSGTLTFNPGVIRQTFEIPVLDDAIYEGDETVSLRLSDPVSATLVAPITATLTIIDDETPPEFSFSAGAYSIDENDPGGTATITVTLSIPSEVTTTVGYATAAGPTNPATAGSDYTAASGVLTFAPGSLLQTFTVSISNDTVFEGDETVQLSLSEDNGGVLGTPAEAVLTIVDDETEPEISFSLADYSVNEAAGPAVITVTLNAPAIQTSTVEYATADGSATTTDDYIAQTGVLTFTPGDLTLTFSVPITNDSDLEGYETVELSLSNPMTANLSTTAFTATLTIVDDDVPEVDFSSATYSVDEGAGTATITVTLSMTSTEEGRVSFRTEDITAGAGDYTATSGELIFLPDDLTQTFTVTIAEDPLYELDETVRLVLFDPVLLTLGAANNPAVLTIVDNDPDARPEIGFNPADYSVAEAAGPAVITVTLSAESGITTTVEYEVQNQTALAGPDYLAASGVLTFSPGETSQTFSVTINADGLHEIDETAGLVLPNADYANIVTGTGTLTIIDDDPAPDIGFSQVDYSVDEAAGPAVITVTLSAESGLTATVAYSTSNGSAAAGSDYSAVSDVLTFSPGITQVTFSVPITSDGLFETDETVQLNLAGATAANIITGAATLTIVDDDEGALPEVDFSSATYTVNEAGVAAVITVTLSAESGLEATVAYTSSNGSATAGSDYSAVSDVLTFAPGITQVTFSVPITNDTDLEGTETVSLTLALANNAVIPAAGNNPATLLIVDDDTPLVRFSSAAYSVDEDAGPAVITVTLSMAPSVTATVAYTSANQTATAGPDYLAASGVLTFSPGETTETFSVTINNDAIYEGPETLQLALGSPNNAEIAAPETAILTIVDNDPQPVISFSSAAYSVAEEAGPAVITVTLSAESGLTATVSYATADDEATAPGDYTARTGVLTFTPGITQVTFSVPIANDGLSEGDEDLQLLLSGESGAGLGLPNEAILTILDDDAPQVGFSSATYSVNEGAGTATITVTLTSALLVESRVSFATEDITATAGDDYTATSGELIFPAGSMTQTFDVPILEDPLDEPDETLRLRLLAPVGLTIPAPTAELTIVDNDDPPVIGFDPAAYVVDEDAGTATITVTLSAVSGLTATVNYATSNGSATAGSDYTATSGQLSIDPGDTTATFTVPISDDSLYEADETVRLTLINAANATLGTDTATLTITDNDLASRPTVSFSSSAYSVSEIGFNATITVTLSNVSGVTATVAYTSTPITAIEGLGNDYLEASGVLTFAPGVLERSFFVIVFNDGEIEDDETVELELLDPVQTELGTPSTATLTIIDDDVPQVGFSSLAYSVNEAEATATITVTLSQAFNKPASVSYATANGSAVAGQDYTSTSNVLTFAAGETSQTFDVPIINDGLYELAETVVLTLFNPISATVGITNPATLTIFPDSDPPPDIGFSQTDYSVDEGAGTAVITVTLSELSGVTATVVYTAENGTATPGSDYQATSGTLLFPPGSLAQTFNVTVIDDAIQEIPETVSLRLGNPVDATIGATNPATLTITDNDVPAASFSSATYSVNEGDGTAIITVTLSVVPLADVSVAYSSSDGSAVAGSDYTPASGVLTFTAGVTLQTFAVPILVDDVGEPDETVQLALSDPINGLLGAITSAELTIIDDDLFETYLPLVVRNAAGPLPDLRPIELIVEPATGLEATTPVVLKVVVQNVGQGTAAANFWVDFYINPSTFPATAGYPWATVCGPSPCYGLAWQVRQPLAPGESITLSSEPGSLYLDTNQTRWDGAFNRGGTQQLGVYVDSWNGYNKPDGFVLEADETNNLIRRDVEVSGAGAQAGSQGGGDAAPVPARPLPEK